MKPRRIGVVVTAANTVLEADLRRHDERIAWQVEHLSDPSKDGRGAASHPATVRALAGDVPSAIARLARGDPQLVVVGLSAAPFQRGVAAHRQWAAELAQLAGVPVVTLADGIEYALSALEVWRVGLLTPLDAEANAPIAAYLEELGLQVVARLGLACPDIASIAAVAPERLHEALDELDSPAVEAIVQVGTNLDFVAVADEAARRIGKPVIAANTAIARAALARLWAG